MRTANTFAKSHVNNRKNGMCLSVTWHTITQMAIIKSYLDRDVQHGELLIQ